MMRSTIVPMRDVKVIDTAAGRSERDRGVVVLQQWAWLMSAALAAACAGCGKGETASPAGADAVAPPPAITPEKSKRRTEAVDAPPPAAAEPSQQRVGSGEIVPTSLSQTSSTKAVHPPGSPEALLQEIVHLRQAPLDVVREPIPGQPGEYREIRLNPAQVAQERTRRAEETIDLASQLIAKTHARPEQAELFNSAVSLLTEARMQLVLAGDQTQAQYLAEDADALYKRDPTSFAAVDAGYRVVQLAQSLAQLQPGNAELARAFSRRARQFVERFPQETSRGAVSLMTAARQCDHLGLTDEAKLCYAVVRQKFAETPFAEQVSGPLRRYALVGQTLEDFGGETHDGGNVSLSQYRGHVVLIAFWSSVSRFSEDLPQIERVVQQYGSERFTVLGVNLDHELSELEEGLEAGGLGYKHIFFHDPQRRGLANPLARHYGVTKVPSYWLIDADGVVRSIDVDPAALDAAAAPWIRATGS